MVRFEFLNVCRIMSYEVNFVCRWLILLGLILSGIPAFAQNVSLGPLYEEFKLTLESGYQTEAVGPLFYDRHRETSRTWALPPLFSHTSDPTNDSVEIDFAYPLLTYDRFGREYRFQIGQLFSFSGGERLPGPNTNVHLFTLFPIYWQGRSADPERNYTAVFPLYGTLKNRLFRSQTDWILWPVYVKTIRRSAYASPQADEFTDLAYQFFRARKGDMTTYNFLVPIFHVRVGESLRGWQFWPLMGHEEKAVTYRTNTWNEVEAIGGHDKFFTLWPFFFYDKVDIGTTNAGSDFSMIPFYTASRSPARDSTSYLWPIGVTVTDDRARRYHEVDVLWPLMVFAHGEGKRATRVLPFYGYAEGAGIQQRSVLWPIYKWYRIQSAPLDRNRTRLAFFLYSDATDRNTETGKTSRRVDLWPLYQFRRDYEGKQRFQMLNLFEPFVPYSKSVDRNWSPIWSIWRSEKNPQTGAASQSLLWNLYRREQTPEAKQCSFLFGLFQHRSGPDGKQWRLFYIPFGKSKPSAPAQPAQIEG